MSKKKSTPTRDGERFVGWPKTALQFFNGLHRDNSKPYFEAHRDVYETAVRKPMETLLAELRRDVGPDLKTKVFRINRDLRFTKDRRPYQEHVAGVFMSDRHAAGFYIQFSREGLYVAAGSHQMASDQLTRYRDAVAGRAGEPLARIVSRLVKDGYRVGEPSLKRVPPGYPADHPRKDLLRRAGLMGSRSWPPRPWLHTGEALTQVRDAWRAARPLVSWLDEHVGPSRAPSRR